MGWCVQMCGQQGIHTDGKELTSHPFPLQPGPGGWVAMLAFPCPVLGKAQRREWHTQDWELPVLQGPQLLCLQIARGTDRSTHGLNSQHHRDQEQDEKPIIRPREQHG